MLFRNLDIILAMLFCHYNVLLVMLFVLFNAILGMLTFAHAQNTYFGELQ